MSHSRSTVLTVCLPALSVWVVLRVVATPVAEEIPVGLATPEVQVDLRWRGPLVVVEIRGAAAGSSGVVVLAPRALVLAVLVVVAAARVVAVALAAVAPQVAAAALAVAVAQVVAAARAEAVALAVVADEKPECLKIKKRLRPIHVA